MARLLIPSKAFVSILCVALGACATAREGDFPGFGSASGFDVVLLTLDTTRADRLGAYGYERAETPALDRLAREGIRFGDAVSPAPLTLPAHASLLTGLEPPNHGVRHNGQYRLDPSRETISEVLRENGYETAAFVSAFVLDKRYGLAQGFDHYDDRVETLPGQPFGGLGERSAEKVTDAALRWLEGRASDKPLFLWVHYYDPHAEYRPPEAFATRFPASPYDGEIAYMDSQIGRLVESLERDGARLLVIVAGDHGESFGEHSEYTHSRLLYETTQHVPLFLWSPALIEKPLRIDDAVVGLIDVFPTVLELLGIPDDLKRDGMSLRLARENRERSIYMETLAPYLDNGWSPLHALRRRRDKYISAPRPEYYDLDDDPGENENLFEERNAESALLAEALTTRLEESPSAEAVAAQAARPDPETLRRLKALGYLSGPGPSGDSGELPDPKDMMPIQGLVMESRGFRKAGRLEEALAKAREALGRAPKDLEVIEENALVAIEMNRLEDAEAALRAYSLLKPNPNIFILLAEILAETKRKPEGEALLEEALELEPDHGGVMITRGDFLMNEGDYEGALAWYQRAKAVDPYRATAVADRRIVELRRRASGS